MRNIFVGYPIKGPMPMVQVRNIVNIARTKFPDCNIHLRFLDGSPINIARMELVASAIQEKCDEIVMIDCDLNVGPPELARLLSHDADVVCAMYCHRSLETHWHVTPYSKDEKLSESGLMRVKQSAIGFSKIKLSVFDKLKADNPDRLGKLTARTGGHTDVYEFFPFELVGANTPASRLNDIKKLCENFDLTAPASTLVDKISALMNTQYLTDNYHISEDYNFCRLCDASGIKIMLDTNLIVSHATEVMLPLPTQQLVDLLKEPWRQDELAMIGKNQ